MRMVISLGTIEMHGAYHFQWYEETTAYYSLTYFQQQLLVPPTVIYI